MGTEYTIEDTMGDALSFFTYDHTDRVYVTITYSPETMQSDTTVVEINKQDLARLFANLDLPEVTHE